MALSADLLEILCCPEDRTPVALAPDDLIARLNADIARGALKNKAGAVVQEPMQAGLLRKDGAVLYPVRDDIPVMLVEEGIVVTSAG